MNKVYLGLIASTFSLAVIGCSHSDKQSEMRVDSSDNKNRIGYDRDHGYGKDKRDGATTRSDRDHPAIHVAKIDFDRGSNILTSGDKKEINDLIKNARNKGKIEEVKILAWADQDFSMDSDSKKAPSKAVDLADARAKAIRSYIRDTFDFSDIDSHNMAARPGMMSKLFKTEDYELKKGTYDADGTPFKAVPEPQKALVVVEMEGDRT